MRRCLQSVSMNKEIGAQEVQFHPKVILNGKLGVQSHSYLRPDSLYFNDTLKLNDWLNSHCFSISKGKHAQASSSMQFSFTLKEMAEDSNIGQRSLGMADKSGFVMMKSFLISHPITWAGNIIPQETQVWDYAFVVFNKGVCIRGTQ